jgi:hypothetical protein
VRDVFPKNNSKHRIKKRKVKLFKTNKTNTKTYKKSAIPYMQALLDKENAEQMLILKGEM